ncbi:unnamed protein product [Ascophyllum nodosum]
MRKTRTAILPIPGCDPILNVALLTGQHLRNIGCDLMPFRQKGEITGVPCTGTDESHSYRSLQDGRETEARPF